jgi:hypothetical protein
MRAFASILAGLLLCFIGTQAMAEKRVALVIGNSSYQHVPNLPNPANDAGAIDLLLKSAGFDVVETRENLGVTEMRRAVRDFSDQVRDADIGVVYYAGHGMEVGGSNYLIPIDATLRRDFDVEDETLSLDRVLQMLEPARRLRLVILDACRDNPFAKSMTRTMASRAIGRGLGKIEPTMTDTLIAYAAKAGSTAEDGNGSHSPFTTALLKHLVTPGLDVRIAFGRTRDDVLRATSNKQEPFVYGSLGGATLTLSSLSPDDKRTSEIDPDAAASRDYEATAKVGTAEAWDSFLKKFPTGLYSELARAQRRKLATLAPADRSKEPNPVDPAPKAAPSPDARKDENRSSSQLSCCLNYYRGERSLEGWGPAERCRRNMASTKADWCALDHKQSAQRKTGEGCSALVSAYRTGVASGEWAYASDAAKYVRRQCHVQ